MTYQDYTKEQRDNELCALWEEMDQIKAQGLQLNMARGVPSPDQLSLSLGMLNVLYAEADCRA